VRIDKIELIVREVRDETILSVGLELDPEAAPPRGLAAVPVILARWRRRLSLDQGAETQRPSSE
jgi:hypothetical protein